MRVARALVDVLAELGVRYLFGLPGSTEASFLDALAEGAPFEYVLALHESAAVAMADGFARASGGLGAANLHTSVGTANGISQLYNAFRDGTPLFVMAGHKSTALHNRDGFCVIDSLPDMVRGCTKWCGQSVRADQIIPDVLRAVKTARALPQGPVYLSLPEDLLEQEAGGSPGAISGLVPQLRPAAEPSALSRAASLLAAAKRPVIIAGDEVARSGGVADLCQLAERLEATVLHEGHPTMARLNFDTQHRLFGGFYRDGHPALSHADCILAAGCRLFVEFSRPGSPSVPPGVPIIHVHTDPREIGKLYPVEVGLVGEAGPALKTLLELVPDGSTSLHERRVWAEGHHLAWVAEGSTLLSAELGAQPMRMGELVKVLTEAAPPDAILVNEAINSSAALLRHYPLRYPDAYHHTSGGAMGWGLPAACGVALAKPGRRVVALLGDGSAAMSIQALWTAARLGPPVVFIVLNNGVYQAVKGAVHRMGGAASERGLYPATDISRVDFVALSQGFGVRARQAVGPEQLRAALDEAFSAEAPFLIEVPIAEQPT